MLVTFGREATRELRERVARRLATPERGLADPPCQLDHTTRWSALLADARTPRSSAAARGSPARWPTSTRPRSPPRTSSASSRWPGWASRRPGAGEEFVEDIEPSSTRWSTTCTCAGRRRDRGARSSSGSRARDRPGGDLRPAGTARRARVAGRLVGSPALRVRRRHGERRCIAASARRLVDFDDLLASRRRAARPGARRGRRRAGPPAVPGRAGRRVPGHRSRCSGRSCETAFHGHGTLCSSATRSRRSTRSAAPTLHLPRGAAAASTTRTLARNWRSDAPLLDGLAALLGAARSVTRASSCARCRGAAGEPAATVARRAPRGCGVTAHGRRVRPGEHHRGGACAIVSADVAADIVGAARRPGSAGTDGAARP